MSSRLRQSPVTMPIDSTDLDRRGNPMSTLPRPNQASFLQSAKVALGHGGPGQDDAGVA